MTAAQQRRERLAMVGIVAVAVVLRLWSFDTIPGGLLIDEGFNGVDIMRVLAGARPLFFSDNFGREPLFIYAQAVAVAMLGRSAFALRFVGLGFGLLAVPTTYAAVRRLVSGRAGLVAAAWVATAPWSLVFSRVGLRSIAVPCLVAAAVYLVRRAVDEPPSRRAIALAATSGMAVAAAISTYTSTRIFPVVAVAVVALAVARGRVRPAWAAALLAALFVAAAAGLLPLSVHFLRHPDDFVNRASAISVFNPGVNGGSATAAFLRSTLDTLGVFTIRGDDAWDRNVAAVPAFDPLFGVLFLAGVGTALALARRHEGALLLLLWLGVMLVPNILTAVGVPNYLRLTGAMPAMAGLAGLGAEWTADQLRLRAGAWRHAMAALMALGAAWGAVWTLVVWPLSSERFYVFNNDLLAAAQQSQAEARTGRRVYTTGPAETDPVLSFLRLEGGPDQYVLVDPRFARAYPPSGVPGSIVVQRSYPAAEDVPADYAIPPTVALRDPAGRPAVEIIRLDGPSAPTLARRLSALFGGVFELTGYDLPRALSPGRSYVAWVTGVARRTDPRDLVWFGHLVDRDQRVWARLDQSAVRASTWRDGDVFRRRFELAVPPEAPRGVYSLAVGLLDRATLGRLRIDANADQALFGPIWVGSPDERPPGTTSLAVRWPTEGIELIGYRIDRPQQPARLTLVWRAGQPPSRDYTLFVHVLGDRDSVLAQADGPLGRPLSTWETGTVAVDQRSVGLPSGARAIALGFYEPESGRRLPAEAGDTVTLPLPPR